MADKKPTRLPKDFNQNKVDDVEITDPERAAREAAGIPVDREYPKHLHKFVAPNQVHDFVEVTNAKEEAAKRREGWMSPQEADAVGRAQAEDAAEDAPTPKVKRVPKPAKPAAPAKAPKPKAGKKATAKAKADPEPGAPAAN